MTLYQQKFESMGVPDSRSSIRVLLSPLLTADGGKLRREPNRNSAIISFVSACLQEPIHRHSSSLRDCQCVALPSRCISHLHLGTIGHTSNSFQASSPKTSLDQYISDFLHDTPQNLPAASESAHQPSTFDSNTR